MSENFILPKRQTNSRSPNVITPSADGAKTYSGGRQVLTGTSKTTAVPRKKNRAKINDKCDIPEKNQHSSNQTAETAVP